MLGGVPRQAPGSADGAAAAGANMSSQGATVFHFLRPLKPSVRGRPTADSTGEAEVAAHLTRSRPRAAARRRSTASRTVMPQHSTTIAPSTPIEKVAAMGKSEAASSSGRGGQRSVPLDEIVPWTGVLLVTPLPAPR